MIYLTGDCHGEYRRFSKKERNLLPFQFTESDSVIICGDFGLCWTRDKEYDYYCRILSNLPFTILWVQGNHENYDMIREVPLEEWHGGKVRHIIRDKIILLERGQIFELEGKTFFTFGGGKTHDVEGGILDRNSATFDQDKKRAKKYGLPYRIRGESWWEQELPNEEELAEARKNLAACNWQVDYCITHCASNRIQGVLEEYLFQNGKRSSPKPYGEDVLTDFFDELEDRLQFGHWFFGHYHEEMRMDERHTVLYKSIVPLSGIPMPDSSGESDEE